MRGDPPTAVRYYAEAIDASREAGDEDGAAVNLHNLGRAELALGRIEQGPGGVAREPRDRAAARLSRGDRLLPRGLAELAMIEEDAARAATLLGASEGLFSEIGAILSPDEAQAQQRVTDVLLDAGSAPSERSELRSWEPRL